MRWLKVHADPWRDSSSEVVGPMDATIARSKPARISFSKFHFCGDLKEMHRLNASGEEDDVYLPSARDWMAARRGARSSGSAIGRPARE